VLAYVVVASLFFIVWMMLPSFSRQVTPRVEAAPELGFATYAMWYVTRGGP
jgi:hypothetical protein